VRTNLSDVLVRGPVAEVFETVDGVELRRAHGAADWRQLVCSRVMPRTAASPGLYVSRPCSSCGRSGYVLDSWKGTLGYTRSALAESGEVAATFEWFGDFAPLASGPSCRPMRLVSSRVMLALLSLDPTLGGTPVSVA
jgi:hypothetical protein